ncbi:hypothetical protein BGX34_008900 [Mortierella sp. NVP85]|nr:hypothetical protein BGX34_008900 [Mortierella sp. NVP85]
MATPEDAQVFRHGHTTAAISTRLDNKTGQRIVLWADIWQIFANTKAILNGGKTVPLLTDDNLKYLCPWRIAHHPGVVLEVYINASKDNHGIPKDDAVVPTEVSSQEPASQDCLSPPFAGKSLHMELSTLSLPETADSLEDHVQTSRTNTFADNESVLKPEDHSGNGKVDSADGIDEPLQKPSSAVEFEAPVGPSDHVEVSQTATSIDVESSLPREDPPSSSTDSRINNPRINKLRINNPSTTGEMLVIQSGSMTIYTQPSILAYHQLHNSYIEALRAGRDEVVTAIECAMDELHEKLKVEMDHISDVQDQISKARKAKTDANNAQQELDDKRVEQGPVDMLQPRRVESQREQDQQQELREETPNSIHTQVKTEDKPLQKHGLEQEREPGQEQNQDSLDPLPSIYDNILAVVTQNYELHEYPYPRLFIVLPKEVHGPNKILKPVVGQFRLYFLCECGTHTMPEGRIAPHQIHLAKHQGYDVVRPTEFFERYGRYVLAQLYMVKYGIRAAGLVVLPLSNSKIVEGLDTTDEHRDYVKKNIDSLVDDSIGFLQGAIAGSSKGVTANDNSMRLDRMTIMENGERRQLEWYLRARSDDRGFGRLYRIITPKSHVKWTCMDHYHASDPGWASDQLTKIGIAYGSFKEHMREARLHNSAWFTTESRNWKGFRRIHKLVITLSPENNLGYLAQDATNGNTVELAIEGFGRTSATYMYNPIMEVISNGRTQSLRLLSSGSLTMEIDSGSIKMAPKMRVLELQSPLDAENKNGMSYLGKILACCPNLVYLGLRLKEQVSLVKVMAIAIPTLKKLELLELYYDLFYTTAHVSDSQIKVLQMNLPFIKHQDFESKVLPKYSQTLNEPLALDQMVEILRESPSIDDIRFGYQDLKPLEIINVSTRQTVLFGSNGATLLRKLRLFSVQDRLHTPCTRIDMDFTPAGVRTEIEISQWEDTDCTVYTGFFHSYGSTIRTLEIVNKTFDDGFARLLDKSTEDNGSTLKSLGLSVGCLSPVGLKCVDRVIKRSKDLEHFGLICTASDIQLEIENAQWLLGQHARALTSLVLIGYGPNALTKLIEQDALSRRSLPSLVDVRLNLDEATNLLRGSQTFVQWLVEMVSVQPSKTLSSSASSILDTTPIECPDISGSGTETWQPLSRLCVNGGRLHKEEWVRILEAIDFSKLKDLSLKNTNFELEYFHLLVKSIERVDSMAPLEILDLSGTALSKEETVADKTLFEALREKAPVVKMIGIEHLGIW